MEKLTIENVKSEFITMITRSWTFNRLTEQEKEKCIDLFNGSRADECIKGTTQQRWRIMSLMYDAFLAGIGYEGWNWREGVA